MNLNSLCLVFIGALLGLSLRLLFLKYLKKDFGFTLDNIAIINIFSSLITGIILALNLNNENLNLFFSIGFLGSFSTFSSFIYKLFNYLRKHKYIKFIQHYFEVISYSGIFFIIGFYGMNLLIN